MTEPDVIVLDTRTLPRQAKLDANTLGSLAMAAAVTLERVRGSADVDDATVLVGDVERAASIVRVPPTDDGRATYADTGEATEEAAEAIAILVARQVLDRVVVRRLQKHSGGDYAMRDAASPDLETFERLECSGIAEGKDKTATRLAQKLTQLADYPDEPPGYAIVTNFRTRPRVEIHVGRQTK